MTSRRHSSELKAKTELLLPQSYEIGFDSCCALQSENSWKIVLKKGQIKNPKSFIRMTLGPKHSCPETTRQASSKSQLSRQSSREKFEKAKTQFIKQLKLWKSQTQDENPQSQTKEYQKRPERQRYGSTPALDQKTKLLLFGIRNNEQGPLHAQSSIPGQGRAGEFDGRNSHRLPRSGVEKMGTKGLMGHLNVIQQVQNHFETSEGLLSRHSTFEVLHPQHEFNR